MGAQYYIGRHSASVSTAARPPSGTLRQEIRELETQRAALQEAGTSADELDDLVIYLAGARGAITSTGVRGVASEISLQQIERSIARLVAAGRLAETDETAKSVGRGRGAGRRGGEFPTVKTAPVRLHKTEPWVTFCA